MLFFYTVPSSAAAGRPPACVHPLTEAKGLAHGSKVRQGLLRTALRLVVAGLRHKLTHAAKGEAVVG